MSLSIWLKLIACQVTRPLVNRERLVHDGKAIAAVPEYWWINCGVAKIKACSIPRGNKWLYFENIMPCFGLYNCQRWPYCLLICNIFMRYFPNKMIFCSEFLIICLSLHTLHTCEILRLYLISFRMHILFYDRVHFIKYKVK